MAELVGWTAAGRPAPGISGCPPRGARPAYKGVRCGAGFTPPDGGGVNSPVHGRRGVELRAKSAPCLRSRHLLPLRRGRTASNDDPVGAHPVSDRTCALHPVAAYRSLAAGMCGDGGRASGLKSLPQDWAEVPPTGSGGSGLKSLPQDGAEVPATGLGASGLKSPPTGSGGSGLKSLPQDGAEVPPTGWG